MARLLICAGGTGGGVYPALSVLQALGNDADPVLWVGGEGGMEADLVKRAGLPFAAIPAAGVHGVGLRALPGNLLRLARGYAASRRILAEFQPRGAAVHRRLCRRADGAGGPRSCLPCLYRPRYRTRPGAQGPGALGPHRSPSPPKPRRAIFPPATRTVVTGYPIRADLAGWTRERGRAHFDLTRSARPAGHRRQQRRPFAQPRCAGGPARAARHSPRSFCISGQLDWTEVEQAVAVACPPIWPPAYHALPYLHEMGAALAAADLVVSRAGASTLGEYPLFGLPAVLVPYPYAWRYQKVNAAYLVEPGRRLPD